MKLLQACLSSSQRGSNCKTTNAQPQDALSPMKEGSNQPAEFWGSVGASIFGLVWHFWVLFAFFLSFGNSAYTPAYFVLGRTFR
eukprot:5800620-Amphidinium_carterae.1